MQDDSTDTLSVGIHARKTVNDATFIRVHSGPDTMSGIWTELEIDPTEEKDTVKE